MLEGAVLTIGDEALRPGEIFALHRPELHFDKGLIHVKRQIDLDTGEITWPKDDDGRWVPMSPAWQEHMERMPRMGKVINEDMGEIVFPGPQGGYMWRSTWSSWWKAICAGRRACLSSAVSGVGSLPDPTNPVTLGVFLTRCQASSDISISTMM